MSTFNIKADFTNGVKIEGGFITFVQQDTQTCELALELLDKGNLIDMTNRRAAFSVVTPSGATIEETHLEVVDATLGKLKLIMPGDMILEAGKYKAQIQLYPLESYARESTLIFNYSVTPSLMSDQKLLATERFGTLEGLIVTVEGLQNDVNGNVETIEKAQVAAEKAKDDALLSASYSIRSATSAKEAAQAADTMTGVLDEVVEQARQSALASTESAQAAKASADEADRAAKTALAATDKANTAVSTANKALADVNTAIVDITEAKLVIDNATITANNAANEATNAVTQTNQLAQTVHALSDKVNTVNQTANSNLQAIDIIANKADSAAGKAEASLAKADEVSKKVDAALVVAEDVVAQANTANLTANKAVVDATNQANIAKGEVTKATEQANKAKTEADRATTQATTALGHANKAKEEADKAGLAGEQAFKDGIHLNGESQSNFNFIENEVVPDGLIYKGENINTKTTFPYIPKPQSTIMFVQTGLGGGAFGYISGSTGWYVDLYKDGSVLFAYYDGTQKVTLKPLKHNSIYNVCCITRLSTHDFILQVNDDIVSIKLPDNFVDAQTSVSTSCTYGSGYTINDILCYNRQLTPQEIQHNFNVLNNSPSISALETTDSTGKTTKQLFCSDSSHVEMRTGYTLEDSYTELLKVNAKEFTADANGEIKVDNAIGKQKVLSASIEGQTVKNHYEYKTNMVLDATTSSNITRKFTPTLPSTKYVAVFFIRSMTGTPSLQFRSEQSVVTFINSRLKLGLNKLEFTTTATSSPTGTPYLRLDNGVTIDGNSMTLDFFNVIDSGNEQFCDTFLPLGLTSTEVSITCNGAKHTFYEPVIQGETKIVDANGNECVAGTAGARLVSLESSVEGLPKLGSVPSVSDTIDRASGLCTLNTKEIVLDGSEKIANWGENGSFIITYGQLGSTASDTGIYSVQDKLQSSNYNNIYNGIGFGMGVRSNYISFRAPGITTIEQARTFISGITIRYQLATPETIQLTPEQLKAYDAYKKPILLPFPEDKFTLNEDGSGTWIDASEVIDMPTNLSWKLKTGFENDNYICAYATNSKLIGISTEINAFCDKFENVTNKQGFASIDSITSERIAVHKSDTGYYTIAVKKSNASTVADINIYLSTLQAKIIIKTDTTTTHIPKSIMPTIPTDKINNLSAGGAVKVSKFTASLPIDKMADVEKRLQALESVTIALS